MGILPQASTFATRADQIFLAVFVLSLGFLVAITGLMIYFVVRYSRKRHARASQIEGHTGLEITWTVVPLVLFVAIFYFGWTNYDYGRRAPRDAMVVKVTGRQWSWSFKYPNGKQTDKLFAALDRPMKVEIHSADVIHGFYVAAFRIKADAVPGRTNMTWFQPTQLGSFDIQCTVICGVDHSAMLSTVEVVPEDDFKAWYFGPEGTPEPTSKVPGAPLARENGASAATFLTQRAALPASATDALRSADPGDANRAAGMAMLGQHGCLSCHSVDGTPRAGPSFKGLFGKQEALARGGAVEQVTMNERELALAITDAERDVVQGYPPMPPVNLTPEKVDAMVRFIMELR